MPDEHQHKVAQALQKVYDDIKGHDPNANKSIFSSLFKAKKNKILGLYIYGTVGTGKTMLMDLFYDCCEVRLY